MYRYPTTFYGVYAQISKILDFLANIQLFSDVGRLAWKAFFDQSKKYTQVKRKEGT